MQSIERINLTNLKKCNQFWDEMTPNERGRVCEKCQNTIIDFRNLTDKEVAEIHVFSKGKVCGLYNKEQLELKKPVKKKKRFTSIYIGLLGILSSVNAEGKEKTAPVKVEQVEPDYTNQNPKRTNVNFNNNIVKDSILITGRLTDEDGEELIYATVHIKGTTIGTSSDFYGQYSLNVTKQMEKENEITLVYVYTGYETQEVTIKKSDILDNKKVINVVFSYGRLTGFVVEKKRPLHKRIWSGIRNIFRKKK